MLRHCNGIVVDIFDCVRESERYVGGWSYLPVDDDGVLGFFQGHYWIQEAEEVQLRGYCHDYD